MTPRMVHASARLAGSTVLATQCDERLLALARHGNERAFEALVDRYQAPLFRYCGKLLPNSRAEDAVQQAFLNAHGAITSGEIDEELNFRPWLYRIAHNASLNLLRQNGWKYDELSEDFDGVQRPDEAVEERERLQVVVAAIKELPERQRDALVLREIEGRSYESVGAELGVSVGAARQLLRRARGALRAAVSAIIPPQLLLRLTDGAASGGLTRASDALAGAGGVAVIAKAAVSVVAVGAIVVGAKDAHIGGDGKHFEANVVHHAEATVHPHAGVANLMVAGDSKGSNGSGGKTGIVLAPMAGALDKILPGAPTTGGDNGTDKVSSGIGTGPGLSGSGSSDSSGSTKTTETGKTNGSGKTETGKSGGSGKAETGKSDAKSGSGGSSGNSGNGSGNSQAKGSDSKGPSGSSTDGSGSPGNSGSGNGNGQAKGQSGGGESKGGSGGKGKSATTGAGSRTGGEH